MANPWRSQAGIHSQFLYTSVDGPIMKKTDEIRHRESRWLPADKYPIVGDFTVVGDDILMLSLGSPNPTGITINSHELAEGLRVIFIAAWELAAKYN
jgi:hypothetical protein